MLPGEEKVGLYKVPGTTPRGCDEARVMFKACRHVCEGDAKGFHEADGISSCGVGRREPLALETGLS